MPPLRDEFLRLDRAVALPPRRFGRRPSEKFVVEQALETIRVDLAGESETAVSIHRLAPPREKTNRLVDQHVCRSDVEGQNVVRIAAGRKPRNVGNASQVQNEPPLLGRSHRGKMKERGQGSPLATRRKVPGPKIRDNAFSRPLRDHRGVRDLRTAADVRMVSHRLPVGRDPFDVPDLHPSLPKQRESRRREGLSQFDVEFPQFAQRIRSFPWSREGVNSMAKPGIERKLAVGL